MQCAIWLSAHMKLTRKALLAGVTVVIAVAAASGGAAYAASAPAAVSAAIKPVAGYACEGSGHVVVTLLSTPSAKCPAGTTSVLLGAQGPAGAAGAAGAKGSAGAQGPQGLKGDTGAPGADGAQGPKGDTGATGPAVAVSFAVASVMIDRGSGATAWATYSAPLLGSPAGDQAQGAFRFTCKAGPDCKLSLTAHATADGWQAYPRVLIMKQVAGAGPEVYCEYGDGSDNNGAKTALASTDAVVPLGIGGTLDCGSSQAYPVNGIASEIDVPGDGGHYDVYTTLIFSKAP